MCQWHNRWRVEDRPRVSARRHLGKCFRKANRGYAYIVEATPECVKIVSPDGSLEYMNPAGLGIGRSRGYGFRCRALPAVYSTWSQLTAARSGWSTTHAFAAGEKLNWQFEIVGLAGNPGGGWKPMRFRCRYPSGQTGQLAVARDITVRKQADVERERLLRESERAARTPAERVSPHEG